MKTFTQLALIAYISLILAIPMLLCGGIIVIINEIKRGELI